MSDMWQTAIGAVIRNDVLTMAIRHGDELKEPIQHTLGNALEAVALLLEVRARHRHDDPIIYLEAGATAGAVLEKLYEADRREGIKCRDQIVDGLSAPLSPVSASVLFYDRRSELHRRFHERVSRGELLVPAAYTEQLAAFGGSEQVKDGKVFAPYVDDVTQKLGRFPALAVAAVLAAIDVPARPAAPREHDPYANLP